MNEKALFQLSYGLYVLTAAREGKQNGCIINTAGQVTNTPNRIQIAVNKANYTHDMIKETGELVRRRTLSCLSGLVSSPVRIQISLKALRAMQWEPMESIILPKAVTGIFRLRLSRHWIWIRTHCSLAR